MKKLSIMVTENDGSTTEVPLFTSLSTPTPPLEKPYIFLNCINWAPLHSLQLADASEFGYFVLPVAASGSLLGGNPILEAKFVGDVHAAGKKATFSIAGGSQHPNDIKTAVTQKTILISNIKTRCQVYQYDGVTLDIENTSIDPGVIVDFVLALRAQLGPTAIIGMYTQPFQLNTVFSKIQDAKNALTWLSPMIYDYPYTITELKNEVLKWSSRVGASKTLTGVAVNYPSGLSVPHFKEVLQWTSANNLKGCGIWENTLYTGDWVTARREVWPSIK